MKLYLKKMGVYLQPDNDESAAWLSKKKQGAVIEAECSQPRNYKFHKKYFALLDYAFDHFEPLETNYNGIPVQKNKDEFRKNLQILAGFGEPVYKVDGSVKFISKSISFGSMEQVEFDDLYSRVFDVILQRVLHNYTKDDLENVVNNLIGFM